MTRTAQTREPLRIGLVTGDVLTREVIKTGNVLGLFIREIKDLPEGTNLGIVDHAVSLRHLGGKRDDGNGKGYLAAGFRVALEQGADGFDNAPERIACRVADCAEQPFPQG
uniref:Vint domain-containing protein n=1 Tax=Globodera pallida TaxID=36090 RepID=A0A183CTT2_GLOPA